MNLLFGDWDVTLYILGEHVPHSSRVLSPRCLYCLKTPQNFPKFKSETCFQAVAYELPSCSQCLGLSGMLGDPAAACFLSATPQAKYCLSRIYSWDLYQIMAFSGDSKYKENSNVGGGLETLWTRPSQHAQQIVNYHAVVVSLCVERRWKTMLI